MSPSKHHVPTRKCIACSRIKPKRDLIRLVSSPEGEVRPDERGREPGRGAYLCRNQVCWESTLKANRRDRLAHALRTTITPENRQILFEYGKYLPVA
ncbi:MAG: YlxR family protein [Dehalococcoidia bacterium]